MSSWSASAYPPPPPPRGRSRSRSPYRGASYPPRQPYPDPPYAQDPYRADWEVYDRDRAWANYERERAAYDYGRRGRSRSPPPDEAVRKRRRSISPWDRNRYERPRYGSDDYDGHGRGYGYTSPHREQYPPPPLPAPYGGSSRRPPPDPHTFDYPASLKQYADWFRYYYPQHASEEDMADKAAEQEAGDGSKPRNGIRARWEKYKKELASLQLQRMFKHHKKSPWFAEKYDPAPEFAALRARVRRIGWRGRMDSFLTDLETGKFDADLNEPESEASSPVKESATNGDSAVNGADISGVQADEDPKPSGNGEDEMQFNVEAEDDAGDQDASRADANGRLGIDTKRNNRGEEISVQPEGNQVMIRTIPPDIGRVKLEEACGKIPGFVYLALGDPLQKRNFYRAGWLKFHDEADMSVVMADLSEKKIEGFKLHVAHNIKPFISRVRYAPEVASKPERLRKDLENVKTLTRILEDQYKTLRRRKDEQVQKNGDSSATANGDANVDHDNDMGESAKEDDPEPHEMGSEAVERRVQKLVNDQREQGLFDGLDDDAIDLKQTVISLDLYLAYLRAAFHTCYYCACVNDHLEELQRKCVKHLRKPLSKMLLQELKAAETDKAGKTDKNESGDGDGGQEQEQEQEKTKDKDTQAKEKSYENRDWKRNDERWLEWLDSKIALLINRDGVDPKDYFGKNYDEELSKGAAEHIKQEDEGKYRCKSCQKLFKASTFVEKHIANKHGDLVKIYLQDIIYFNNFALDPHRIQPFAHPPPHTGNSQAPPPQAYGLLPPADYGHYPGWVARAGNYPPAYLPNHYAGVGGAVHWDPYAAPQWPQPQPPRGGEAIPSRRLSDRISGFAPNADLPPSEVIAAAPASAGLPAKPVAAALESIPVVRRGSRAGAPGGPPPPPPPDAKEDPRAAAGRKVSYHDMDLVAEGDVELTY